MLRTLQLYISRELIKTFTLSAVGLTLVFSLCGGVLNMIQAEVLTALQVARILGFILPVALTLTLPVSALFACAMVYGRIAADNEFDACKASGINIHRLLLPALLLSIFTAAFTFTFTNYILPTFVGRLEALVRKDLEKIVIQAFGTRGYIKYGQYVLYARNAQMIGSDEGHKTVHITDGAFLQIESESLRTCGTAEEVRVDFLPPLHEGGNPVVSAAMQNVRALDISRDQFYQERHQPIQSMEIPSTVKQKVKWLTLPELLHFRHDLLQLNDVQEQVASIRLLIKEASFYDWLAKRLREGPVTFKEQNRSYTLRAGRVTLDPADYRPDLFNVQITEKTPDFKRDYKAERAVVRVKRGGGGVPDMIQFILRGNASFVDSRDPRHPIEKREIALPEVPAPPEAVPDVSQLSAHEVLAVPQHDGPTRLADLRNNNFPPLGLGSRLENARHSVRKDVLETGLEIIGVIHSRLAFSVSVLTMLVLSAGLAIIYRGGQILTAFAISFIPGLFVVVMNITGRQLAENYATQMAGIALIWGAIVLVAITDVIVLTKFLRR